MLRSSITPRPSPSQLTPAYKLKCVICGQVRHNKIAEKYRISEKQRADDLRKAVQFLQDDPYTGIYDLTTNDYILSVDIYYPNHCFQRYMRTFESSKKAQADFIRGIFSHGNGISLSEIRDIIQNDSSIPFSFVIQKE